jgi:hypothetical protein
MAQAGGFWQPMPAGVWPEHGHSTRTTSRRVFPAAERGTWRTRHRLNGGGETVHRAQPLRRYSRTHSRWPGRGSSPRELSGRRKLNGEMKEGSVQWSKGLVMGSFFCTGKGKT